MSDTLTFCWPISVIKSCSHPCASSAVGLQKKKKTANEIIPRSRVVSEKSNFGMFGDTTANHIAPTTVPDEQSLVLVTYDPRDSLFSRVPILLTRAAYLSAASAKRHCDCNREKEGGHSGRSSPWISSSATTKNAWNVGNENTRQTTEFHPKKKH